MYVCNIYIYIYIYIYISGDLPTFQNETLQLPTNNYRSKEIALQFNILNDKKTRCESHKNFLSKCYLKYSTSDVSL